LCGNDAGTKLENKTSFQQQYKLLNNQWGKWAADGTVYAGTQCVSFTGSKLDQFVLKWDWLIGQGGNVKGYPEIIYGFKPFDTIKTTNSWLPKKIADIGKFNVSHSETQPICSGKYNVAFDGWITSSAVPSRQTITHELMVWERNQGMVSAPYITTVTIDNISYELHAGTRDDGAAYIAFVNTNNSPINTLNVKSILDYLVTNNYVPASSFLASWEFGAEVIEGKCEISVQNYRIDTGLAAISITSPNNGGNLYTANANTVQWTVSKPVDVVVSFSKDRGIHWKNLSKVLANTTSFSWKPNADNLTNRGLMRVCIAGTNLCDVSDMVFIITNP
jgi:hypothetical protein